LSRGAFEGVFSLENLDKDAELTEIKIEIDVYDDDGNLVVTKFAVSDPLVSGFTAVDGSGELNGGETGTAIFTILANNEAAPMAPTDYRVGGRVSYLRNGLPVQFALAPAAITVTPPPVIKLDYFLQRDVFSDDPFTSFKEAPQPFVLGLLARNTGRGDAKDFTITSGEPKIIENELGLKIAFDLIGSSVNGSNNTVNPSLTVDLGELAAGAVSEAHWLMTSSLQGRFIDYAAKVEYVNPLGFKELAASFSQIENVTLHELTRMVRDDRDGADNRFDYLVNRNPPKVGEDNTSKDLLPDRLYLSNGVDEDVAVIAESDITVSELSPLGEATIVFVDANFEKWDYLVIDDPSHGLRPIRSVRRADGSFLDLQNVWITDRTFPEHGRPLYEYRLHLLDRVAHGESASYTIEYNLSATNNAPSLAVALGDLSVDEGSSLSFIVPSTTFTDKDRFESLSYSATLEGGGSLPAWLSFNSGTRTFAGIPANADIGVIEITVVATDSKGLFASDSFSITVQDINAPALQGITVEGNTLLLQFSEPITATAVPFTAFNVKVGSSTRSVTAIAADPIDPSRLLLTFAGSAPSPSQSLSFGYTDSSGNQITNVIQDASGLDLATIPQHPGFVANTFKTSANLLSLASGYENIILVGAGNLGAVGNANANRITGNSGNNVLNGLAGADSLVGGLGNDVFFVDDLGDYIVELVGEGDDLVRASLTWTLADNLEQLILLGSANADATGNSLDNTLQGNSAANYIYGLAGSDKLFGMDGDDTLDGGLGADTMNGGTGNDAFYVDSISDFCYDAPGQGTDTVISSIGWALDNYIENLTLTGAADINAWGNEWNNFLVGNSGNNVLNGNGGIDTMIGGLGNDSYIVDNTGDVAMESVGEGIDWVQSSVSWTLGDNFENLVLIGSSSLVGRGNNLNNRIESNGGNSTLDGGLGRDTLVGAIGADTYRFATSISYGIGAADRILNFNAALGDRIVIDRGIFGIGADSASLISVDSAGMANALITSNLFVYNTTNGQLFYNANGSTAGFGAGGVFALLSGSPALQISSLVLQ
jgi:Ca2+-binding RTX toxin-like protein